MPKDYVNANNSAGSITESDLLVDRNLLVLPRDFQASNQAKFHHPGVYISGCRVTIALLCMFVCVCVDHYHTSSFSHLTEMDLEAPPQKKNCFEADFYYFGLSCLHLKVQVSNLPDIFLFKMFTNHSSAAKGMADMITEEMRKLRDAKVGGNERFKPEGRFILVGGVYIYEHSKSAHAACSRVTASQLAAFGVTFEVEDGKMLNCGEDDHLLLEPYFKCNQYVLDAYQEKVGTASEEVKQDLMKDIELLMSKDPKKTYFTPFREPSVRVFDWDENHWTYRLCYGIKRLFPNAGVYYSAEDGLQWETNVLDNRLGVNLHLANCFLLRGAPDIIINSDKLLDTPNPGIKEDESSEDETTLIERSHQPTRLKSSGTELPEKVGEVFAGLYILLMSKIIRRISRKKSVDKVFKVDGLLIDKLTGLIHCSLICNSFNSPLKFKVIHYVGSLLTVNNLCMHLKVLITT